MIAGLRNYGRDLEQRELVEEHITKITKLIFFLEVFNDCFGVESLKNREIKRFPHYKSSCLLSAHIKRFRVSHIGVL